MRALIFDLDDTLIDTHGQLVQEAHWQACLAMHAAGLPVAPQELMQTRQRLLISHPRDEINTLLAQYYGFASEEIIRAGFETYFNPVLTQLDLLPGVRPLLEVWAQQFLLFLVTSGYAQTQKRKVELLNIEHLFTDIIYADIKNQQGKHEAFSQIYQQYGGNRQEYLVIGDRINNEILAGNLLGMTTVWIRHGECAHIMPQTPEEEPHYRIHHVRELEKILTQSKSTG